MVSPEKVFKTLNIQFCKVPLSAMKLFLLVLLIFKWSQSSSGQVKLAQLLLHPELMQVYQTDPKHNIIFIESSGRNYLEARQACAIESAARTQSN